MRVTLFKLRERIRVQDLLEQIDLLLHVLKRVSRSVLAASTVSVWRLVLINVIFQSLPKEKKKIET